MANIYILSENEHNELIDALHKAQQARRTAYKRYPYSYQAPVIELNQRNITTGRFAPDNAQEVRQLTDMLRNIKPEDFTSVGQGGITGLDYKFADIVNEKYQMRRTQEVKDYNEMVQNFNERAGSARTRAQRELFQTQASEVQKEINRIEGYEAFTPETARDRAQFKSRVLGRQGVFSESYQALVTERYHYNYLKAIRSSSGLNISPNSKTYRTIKNMSDEEFSMFMQDNPQLEDAFIYETVQASGAVNRLASAVSAWSSAHA